MPRLQYVVGNNSMRGVNEQELVYDTGYEKMFGSSLARSRLILLSLCVFVAVYSASSALGMEYDLKVMNLLRSTKRGRLPILTTKIGTVFKITFLMAVLIHLPFILKIVKSYPMDNWGAKVRSMPFAGESVLNCTIGEYVFLLALSQFLFAVCYCTGGCGAVCTVKRYDFDKYFRDCNLYRTACHGMGRAL